MDSTCTIMILEFQQTVSIETSTANTITVTSHGLLTDDFIVNHTRQGTNLNSAERGARRILKIDNDTIYISPAISGQTTGDIVSLFKFVDRTSYLLDGTLSINLKAQGASEAEFSIYPYD